MCACPADCFLLGIVDGVFPASSAVAYQLVLGDATILSLNCDMSKTRDCNRTLVAETIISR